MNRALLWATKLSHRFSIWMGSKKLPCHSTIEGMPAGSMEGAVRQQALLLSCQDSFAFVGIRCNITIPLAFLYKIPKEGVEKVAFLE